MKNLATRLFFALALIVICNSINSQVGDKFLIVLDIQQSSYPDGDLDSESPDLIQAINNVIEKSNPDKVIYVKSVTRALTISFKGIKVDTLANADFDSRLKIVSNNIFTKGVDDAFADKRLLSYLQDKQAKEVVVIGLLVERCVSATTLGGIKRGYSMFIIPDAIKGLSPESKIKTIEKLSKKGAVQLALK